MRALRFALGVVALGAGCFDAVVPADAAIGCVDDGDCPPDTHCLVSLCRPADVGVPVATALTLRTTEDRPLDVELRVEGLESARARFRVLRRPTLGTLEVDPEDATGARARYTPAADQSGDDSFDVIVSDADSPDLASAPATIAVHIDGENDLPVAEAQAPITLVQGASASVELRATDVDGDPLAVRFIALPVGGTLTTDEASPLGVDDVVPFVDGAATLRFTAGRDDEGDASFVWVVDDGVGASAPIETPVTVHRALRVEAAPATAAEDEAIEIPLVAQADGVEPTLSIVGATHGTATLTTGPENSLRFVPDADFFGEASVTVVAAAAGATTAPLAIAVNVVAVNDAPVLVGPPSLRVEQGGQVSLLLHAADVDGDALSFRLATAPAAGTLIVDDGGSVMVRDAAIEAADGELALTFVAPGDAAGAVDFTVVASDGRVESEAVDVHIAVLRELRITPVPTVDVDEDRSVFIPLSAQAEGATPVLSVVAVEHGSAVVEADGVRFAAEADFFGAANVVVVASANGDTTPPLTIAIEVAAVNDAPHAVPTAIANVQQSGEVVVGLGGSDVDGDALRVELLAAPSVGTLDLPADPTPLVDGHLDVTYFADADFAGRVSFTWRLLDGSLASEPVTTTIVVDRALRALPPGSPAVGDEDEDILIALDGQAPAGETPTFAIVTPPAHGSAVIVDGRSLRYSPAADFFGADAVTIVAQATGVSAPLTLPITVRAVNDAPACPTLQVDVAEDDVAFSPLDATDVDGDLIAITIDPLTSRFAGTADVDAAGLIYRPAPDFVGEERIGLRCSDGAVDVTSSVLVTVTETPDAPVALPTTVPPLAEDTTAIVVLEARDVDAGDALTFTLGAPGHGTVEAVTQVGSVLVAAYTPARDYNGPDGFTFQARDRSGRVSSDAAVSLTVTPVNDAPTLRISPVRVPERDAAFDIIAELADVDGDIPSLASITAPLNGQTFVFRDGAQRLVIRYLPRGSPAFLNDSFTAQFVDGKGGSVAGTFAIERTGAPSCAVAQAFGDRRSGVHVIDPGQPGDLAGETPRFLAHCEMGVAGGGWTLVLRGDGRQRKFAFDKGIWNAAGPTNADFPDFPSDVEAKLTSFATVPVREVLLGFAPMNIANGVVDFGRTRYVRGEMATETPSLTTLFDADGTALFVAPSTNVAARWQATSAAALLRTTTVTAGLAQRSLVSRVRIGVLGSATALAVDADSFIGFGAAVPDNGVIATVGAGQGTTFSPSFGAVWVRSRDFTSTVPSRQACALHNAAGAVLTGTYLVNNVATTCPFGDAFLAICGDQFVEGAEECDDGNFVDADACDNRCLHPVCGNARVDGGEQCDDGNTNAGDGCSPVCTIEGT